MYKPRIVLLTIFIVSLFITCPSLGEDNSADENLYRPMNNAVAGNPDGDVTLVVFFDFGCDVCKRMEYTVNHLRKLDPKLRIVYKEVAVLGDKSKRAALAALAAQEQGRYLPFKTALLRNKQPLTNDEIMRVAHSIGLNTKELSQDMRDPELRAQLQENSKIAAQIGASDTPSYVIGKTPGKSPSDDTAAQQILLGGQNLQELQRAISQIRKS